MHNFLNLLNKKQYVSNTSGGGLYNLLIKRKRKKVANNKTKLKDRKSFQFYPRPESVRTAKVERDHSFDSLVSTLLIRF